MLRLYLSVRPLNGAIGTPSTVRHCRDRQLLLPMLLLRNSRLSYPVLHGSRGCGFVGRRACAHDSNKKHLPHAYPPIERPLQSRTTPRSRSQSKSTKSLPHINESSYLRHAPHARPTPERPSPQKPERAVECDQELASKATATSIDI